jgi:hypothetical protein
MNKKPKLLLAGVVAAAVIGGGVATVSGSASAAEPPVASGCWIDVVGDFLVPDAALAPSAQAAIAAEATVGGKAPGVARVALGTVDAAQLNALQRMQPGTPAQLQAVARTTGTVAETSQENIWVSKRSDGVIDGSVVVTQVTPGHYAVSEKHFVLPASVDCNVSQLK